MRWRSSDSCEDRPGLGSYEAWPGVERKTTRLAFLEIVSRMTAKEDHIVRIASRRTEANHASVASGHPAISFPWPTNGGIGV